MAKVQGALSDHSPKRFERITILASYDFCSEPGEFQKLLLIAEKGCISINTIKNGMEVTIQQG